MGSKKVFKNYIYNVIYQVIVVLAPIITTPYISRVLGATNIGVFSYVQSIATYFVLFGALGSSLYGQREIAYVQDDADKRTLVFKEIITFRIITVLLATLIYMIIFCRGGARQSIYLIMTVEVAASAFDISWFFMGLQDFKRTVMRNVIIKVLSILLMFVLVKKESDVVMYAICYTVPILISNLSLWPYLPKYLTKAKPDKFLTLKHLIPMLVLFVPQIATEVYTVLDKPMLGLLSSGMDEVGFYEQSQKVIKVLVRIVTALGLVMLSKISKDFEEKKFDAIEKSIEKSFRFVFLLGCPLMFGAMGVAQKFVPLFYGKGYGKIVPLMLVCAPIILIIGLSNVIGKQYLLPLKLQKQYTISIISGAVINFVFNLVLIRIWNSIGAAVATVIAECSVTAVQIFFVRKNLNIMKYFICGIRYIFMGILVGLCAYFVGKITPKGAVGLTIQVVSGMLCYLLMIMITKDKMLMEAKKLLLGKSKKG